MIIYEVNCLVDESVADAFRSWLTPHIESILTLEGFLTAEVLSLVEDDRLSSRANSKGFSIRYRLNNPDALTSYLKHHADAFRQEGLDRFGGQFSAYRRVLAEE